MASELHQVLPQHQPPNLFLQRLELPVKTYNHCRQHFLRPDPRHIQTTPCTLAQQEQEGQLRSAIALAERVDGIEVGEESRGGGDELFPQFAAREGPAANEANSSSICSAICSGKQNIASFLAMRIERYSPAQS